MNKANAGRPGFSALRVSNRAFAVFFAMYTASAIFLLLLGLGPALAKAFPAVQETFLAWGRSGGPLATLWLGMARASYFSEDIGRVVLDYLFSTLNIGLGVLIVRQRPGNWAVRVLGLALVGTASVFNFQAHGVLLTTWSYVSAVHLSFHAISGATYVHALMIFPNGRLFPRISIGLVGILYLLIPLSIAFIAIPLMMELDPNEFVSRIDYRDIKDLDVTFFIVFFGIMTPFVGVTSQVYRYHSVYTALERQQTKLVVWAIGVSFVAGMLLILIDFVLNTSQWINDSYVALDRMTLTVIVNFPLLFTIIAIALVMAILRYRLWDIDIIINRTLVYGSLTAVVVGSYALVVGGLGALFQTQSSLLWSILVTGLVAVVFQPLRERLQRGVNRLMYGQRDDPYAVLARLGQRLEALAASEQVLPAIVESVAQASKLPYAAIALKERGEFKIAAAHEYAVEYAIKVPLVNRAEVIGQLIVAPRGAGEEFSGADQRLLRDISLQAAAAVRVVRLTADLQGSRERLVMGREEERRRLQRDLHDGLGPTLASQTLRLDAVLDRLEPDPEAARGMLVELKNQVQSAVAEIRRLVYDLRPQALDQVGLVAAVRAFASAPSDGADAPHGLRIKVEVPEQDLPPVSAAVEVAAYRIASEALTNAARHSQARNCVIRFSLDDAPERARMLQLEIMDDGRGLPEDYRTGVGLNSMRERAEELGGTWEIGPSSNGGTRVLARLPLAPET